MERRIINSKLSTSGWFSLGFLVLGAIGSVLYSPKWHNQVLELYWFIWLPLALGRRPNTKPRNIMIWLIALIYPWF
jgi:hypothetical protein